MPTQEIPVIPFQQVGPQQGQAGFQQGDAFQQIDPSGLNPQVDPKGFLKIFGDKLKEIWNQGPMPGSEDDPRDPQGSRIINGMHEDLYNADPGYQKRFNDSLGL